MAFSGSSYFFGIGTAFAAIAVGFAGGAMITTSGVQPPNRLERVAVGAVVPAEQANAAKPASQDTPPAPDIAATPPPASAADPQSAPPPQPAPPVVMKTDTTTSAQERTAPAAAAKNSSPTPVAKSDDTAPAKNERTTVGRVADPSRDVSRPADPNKDIARKRADDRKPSDDRRFSDRRRRQDQGDRRLDEATNAVRQMPRGTVVNEIAERDEAPRPVVRPRRFELLGDDDGPRMVSPPRFGFFGD